MADRWILRKGTKESGFRYVTEGGKAVRAAKELTRIDGLRIPPAWREVHVAAGERHAVQAWGLDVKGRKQYRYHERAVARGTSRKFYRVRRLGRDLPRIRDALTNDLRGKRLTQRRVTAGIVRLISDGFFRVGSERYAKENKTFGVSTMLKSHVHVRRDMIEFSYVGKRNIEQRQVIVDREMAAFISPLLKTPGPRLFRYESADGWNDVKAGDVNEYIKQITGIRYSAKDFRTWGGTLRLATVLADLGVPEKMRDRKKNVVTAIRLVAAELGNTPAICRASYVHPVIIDRYLAHGETIAPVRRRGVRRQTTAGHAVEEQALIAFLKEHFPERRKRVRREDQVAA